MAALVGVILSIVAGLGMASGNGGPVPWRVDQSIMAPGDVAGQASIQAANSITLLGPIQAMNGNEIKVRGIWVTVGSGVTSNRLIKVGVVVRVEAVRIATRFVAQDFRIVSLGGTR